MLFFEWRRGNRNQINASNYRNRGLSFVNLEKEVQSLFIEFTLRGQVLVVLCAILGFGRPTKSLKFISVMARYINRFCSQVRSLGEIFDNYLIPALKGCVGHFLNYFIFTHCDCLECRAISP